MSSSLDFADTAALPVDSARLDLAVEAVQFALPLYEMARMRSSTCPRVDSAGRYAGAAPESLDRWANEWFHTRVLLGPQHRRVVTPNNDTLYSSAWLDLSDGPLLIRVPAMAARYYVLGLLDLYTNPFGYIGTRTTGNEAGAFFLHGPAWSGEVPMGMRAIACPTDSVWLIGRILVDGEADLAAAVHLQDRLELAPAPGSAAQVPKLIDAGIQPTETLGNAQRFAQVVNRLLADDPPPREAQPHVARFAECGIGGQCKDHALDARQRDLLERALELVMEELAGEPPLALGGGWALPVDVHATFGEDYRERAQVALCYIGALGVDEAMYITADTDAQGIALDGNESYVLHFAAGNLPAVDAFWSLTAYEKATFMLAENAIGRYSLGDRTRGLQYDADGGLRIAISAHMPVDPALQRNWLPAPAGRFYLALRLYVPRETHLARTFAYPPIQRVAD
ncbi:MAG TPA: DUF1254 domain-containing protein [Paraburkholderia sp.]|uniref:DUF1254 domain-containing protein n=1 Tax=Paraburkholderia sp. TaxID=1926495 RepID=UPI002B48CF85|nr:DUF1254 domain-containing protein [Paraburkholderia sp.]HKR43563.1 DUF1254 domain-containing protein [Paraburkholderia sp.]